MSLEGEGPMSKQERVRILRSAKPNTWVAFSADESRLVAQADTYDQVVSASEQKGENDPVLVKVPDEWLPLVL